VPAYSLLDPSRLDYYYWIEVGRDYYLLNTQVLQQLKKEENDEQSNNACDKDDDEA